MTTTPSMPIELTREPRVVRIEPFVISWHARGAPGGADSSIVRLHVHEVDEERAAISVTRKIAASIQTILRKTWTPAAIQVEDGLIHIDAELPPSFDLPACDEESLQRGPLLRATLTADLRPIYIRSSLPAIAGLDAGRYEPPQLERMKRP